MRRELRTFFSQFVSEDRLQKMEEVIRNRTRFLTIVLEDIYQPHNASAVLRSCDCFGVQDVHIIENKNTYNINPDIVLGSEKWLTLKKYNEGTNNTMPCLRSLKEKGYKLVATVPGAQLSLPDLQPDVPMAIMMGTELHGLSREAREMADIEINIPMSGFTQSFNISVSAALVLYDQTLKLRGGKNNWKLSEEEQNDIMIDWLKRCVKKPELLEEEFLKRKH